jgi:hypothetical protein
MIKLLAVAEGSSQLNTPRLPRNFQNVLEISVRVDGGVGWKDEYAMGWCGLLAKGCTECTPDGASHGRTRIGAFHSTPTSEQKTQFKF